MKAGLHTTGLLVADWAAAAGRSGFTVLDTEFGPGFAFGQVVQAWQNAAQRPRVLHYVGLVPAGTTAISLGRFDSAVDIGALTALDDGFHRIVLDALRVSLTLCIGEPQSMLGELRLQADYVLGDAGCAHWDKWWFKDVARCCRRGTSLHFLGGVTPPLSSVQDGGFEWVEPAPHSGSPQVVHAVYAPRWQIKTSRRQSATQSLAVGRCAVIGAGLSGAAVAHVLALRGWRVEVYDQHTEAAQGASGLPAGLVVPHVSADDSPRSRLSRRGTRLMLAHAQRLLVEGRDWQQTGVLEQAASSLWHPLAGWIKPAQMVRAWLSQTGISFVGGAAVASLQRSDGQWLLRDANAQLIGQADVVVLANAHGCAPLLQSLADTVALDHDLPGKLAALQQLHGTLSIGRQSQAMGPGLADGAMPELPMPPGLPTFPVNGNGSFLPGVPGENGFDWYAGATYETDPLRIADVESQHRANADKLLQLLPESGLNLMPDFAQGAVRHWSSTRCVTHDRMPLVGPVDAGGSPTVWMCIGMGSRGLSFAALCAELLAAQMGAEPWPVEASLARSLQVNRLRRSKT